MEKIKLFKNIFSIYKIPFLVSNRLDRLYWIVNYTIGQLIILVLCTFFHGEYNESAIKPTNIIDYYGVDNLQHDLFSIINIFVTQR